MSRKAKTSEQKALDLKHLKLEISVLSKRANQRLRQLEESKRTKGSTAYQYVKREQYDDKEYITTGTSSKWVKGELVTKDVVKFKTTSRGRTEEQLREQLRIMKKFLSAKTSTVRGMNEVSDYAYKRYKEETGTNPDREHFDSLWNGEMVHKLIDIFGSKTVVELNQKMGDNLTDYDLKQVFKEFKYIDKVTGEVVQGIDESTDTTRVGTINYKSYKQTLEKIENFKIRW